MKLARKKGHFLLGSTLDFASGTLQFIESLQNEYGEAIVHSKIGFKDFYFLLNEKAIDHVLRINQKNYHRSFAYDGLKDFLGNGLLTNEGQHWQQQRRQIQPAFSKKKLAFMAEGMWKTIEADLKSLETQSKNNASEVFNVITMHVVCNALFGSIEKSSLKSLNKSLYVLRKHANDKLKNPLKLPLWFPNKSNRSFFKAKHEIESILQTIFDTNERLKEENLLTWLRYPKEGDSMPDKQLFDEISTLFVAGQETTTQSICFTLFLLNQHKHVLKKLEEEINRVEPTSAAEFHSLPYLDAVVKESLRLYPPAWAMSRAVVEEDTIEGVTIPKDSTVFLSIFAMHRNPAKWKDPTLFHPDRFLGLNKDPEAYLPFGAGPRMCVGNHFAIMEIKMILVQFLQKFTFKVLSPQRLEVKTPMTMSAKEDIIIETQVKKRNKISCF